MSQDTLTTELKAFGLEDDEAQVYVRLARLGKARASSLSSALKINRTTMYRILERLKHAGVVEATMTKPVTFIAIEPKKALQVLIDRRRDELKAAEGKYNSVIDQFTKFYIPTDDGSETKFSILQGSDDIHRAISRLAKGAGKKIAMITSVRDLGRMYYTGVYEALSAAAARGVKIEIVTEIADLSSLEIVRNYEFADVRHKSESKMKMILKDEQEVLITVASGAEEEVALWTYSQSFASAMQSVANNEMRSAIELDAIATALRTGKAAESFKILTEEKEYLENLMALLASAKTEVYIGFHLSPTFSSPAILTLLKSLANSGVKVHILSAPSSEEADIVRTMADAMKFRISTFQTDVEVLIVDRKEMLFSNAPRSQGKRPGINIRTNLAGMVSFIHNIVAGIWVDSREYILELETLQQSITLNKCVNMVKGKLQERGIEIEVGNKMMGKSGVLHKFDIICPSPKTGGRIVILFISFTNLEATRTRLMEAKIKLLDCERIDIVLGIVGENQEEEDASVAKLAKAVGLNVIQGSDIASLAERIQVEVEKRY